MTALSFGTVAQFAASRVLNTMVEGLALAGLSWIVLRMFGARSSMTRFTVWFSTLLGIVALPLLMRSSSPAISSWRVPELSISRTWALGLLVAWAVIAGFLLIRLAVSLWHVRKLRRECREINAASHPVLMEAVQQFSQIRRVKLMVSEHVRVPTALGFSRPSVVLPPWTLRELSLDELKVIVLHELAHLRRWDDWTNLAQKLVKAVFFFHPAVWWIESHLALEREVACDDLVLEQTANPEAYAASLVSVAEKFCAERVRMGRALALAQTALGRMRQISARLTQILDRSRERKKSGWRPAAAMIGGLAVITVGAMQYAPEVISFQDRTEPVFSAESSGVSSVIGGSSIPGVSSVPMKATPVVFKETVSGAVKMSPLVLPKRARTESRRTAIAAKTALHKPDQALKVVMAKALERKVPTATLVVLHSTRSYSTQFHSAQFYSTQFGESGSAVWTLCVWRTASDDGVRETVEETIVVNSI
jgi:beta-lactamase regulating signal transducer with metallopeptidase domain